MKKRTHIAVVVNSVTNVSFYFNGVLQSKTQTDGASTSQSFTHYSAHAWIGNQANQHAYQPFTGQIDEVRLWNVLRTETEIREWMCQKFSSIPQGLIGYWKGDDSYISSTMEDFSGSGIDGTISGTTSRITSGAPIGDKSKFEYTNDWTGEYVTIQEGGSGDLFGVGKIQNDPHGVHVYLVKDAPYDQVGLGTFVPWYFGVFCAEKTVSATFDAGNRYHNNLVINESNEADAELRRRADGSITLWEDALGILYPDYNTYRDNIESSRKEYILNLPDEGEKLSAKATGVLVFPNPATDKIFLQTGGIELQVSIFDLLGRELMALPPTVSDAPIEMSVAALPAGSYLLLMTTSAGPSYSWLEVSR